MASIAGAGRRVSVVRYLGRGSIRFENRYIRQRARSAADTSRNTTAIRVFESGRDSARRPLEFTSSATEPVIGIFNINRAGHRSRHVYGARQLFHMGNKLGIYFILRGECFEDVKTIRCSVKSFDVMRLRK